MMCRNTSYPIEDSKSDIVMRYKPPLVNKIELGFDLAIGPANGFI